MADINETSHWDTNEVKKAQKEQRTTRTRATSAQPTRRRSTGSTSADTTKRRPREEAPGQEGQAPRKRRPRKRKRKSFWTHLLSWILYVVFVVVISAALAGFGWILACDLCAFNKVYETATVEVTETDTVEDVAEKLKEAGLIEYPWFFQLFGLVAGAEEKIGPGTHELNTDMDYRALITGMYSASSSSAAATVTVTIPEGYTVAQTLSLLAEKGVNTEEAFIEAAETYEFDYAFIDNESEDMIRLEGYLFPDTYEFYVGESASSALNRLLKNFTTRISDYAEDIEASPYSLAELVIIASLIEKETDGSDHASIASVIYNRLNDTGAGGTYKMLQIDAALIYALPEGTTTLTNADKELDSPYNLYKYAGLPPTAIANPGLNSLYAAIYPADTNYYYYALGISGEHSFFTNYSDHVNFINSGEYGG